ncbi:TrkH family potassium uptake protein [Alkalihalobacillus sp. TS-13]|uniref:TrkH family potassium uptake protein n=1 Tax=Alkalihalobacillus sp. TS-13 TaxID=2842455 RepID=UPI001C8865A7|nr:TrkH family potassium uptake protein [Alkalihalobacillus sp. TS-13]
MKMKRNPRLRKIRLTSVQMIILFYLGAVVLATSLLSLPYAHRGGMEWSFIDALFTAVSAISVTGLTVVNTAETFNEFGYFILAFVLQFGGIGIMTLGTFIWLLVGKRITLKERQLIMADQNLSTLQGLVRIMKQILFLILIIESIGTLILGVYFMNYFDTWQQSFIQGFFASVSATTNGGFDITGQSLRPFANDYFVQFINILLMILGAIGFPVLLEVKEYLISKNGRYQFSLFTKLTTVTFLCLVVVGTLFIILLEHNLFYEDKSWHQALFYSLFQSVTTRSGGLSTMDMNLFSEPTQLFLSALMFIGASPSSVGGGIRTTTFVIVILAILSFAKGNQTIKVFRRELLMEDVHKAFVVLSVAVMMFVTAVLLLMYSESAPMIPIVFEVASAFGTCGLSMGLTPELSSFGKIIVILLMFIGRVGILSFLFIIRGKIVKETYHYPKEHVIIG